MCLMRSFHLLRNLVVQSLEHQPNYASHFYSTKTGITGAAHNPSKKHFVVFASIGNPEPEYQGTRHNLGHMFITELAKNHWNGFEVFQRNGGAARPVFSSLKEFEAVALFKSTDTFMNLQGTPINRMWTRIYNDKKFAYSPALVVIHDELSLPLGKFQVRRRNSSPRGHNGLRSINSHIGNNYTKISIGIGKSNGDVTKHVLSKFTEDETEILLHDVFPKLFHVVDEMKEGKFIFESTK